MSNEKDASFLRKLFSDIIRGYTSLTYKNSFLIIKHFTSLDQGSIDEEYNIFYNQALSEGLPNEEDRLKTLIESESWTRKEEAWLDTQRRYISSMHETKTKLTWLSQIEDMDKQINSAISDLNKKNQERKDLLGMTAETYASKKLNEKYIYYSFRKENFKDCFFDKESFDDLSSNELNDLIKLYNNCLKNFDLKNLKKIGLSSFMQSMYNLSGDDVYAFYGKAVTELTFYQIEIFSYGRFFKHILSQDVKYDEKTLEDPELLINAFTSSQNARDVVGPVEDGDTSSATMLYGVKKSDIRAAGGQVAESMVSKAIKSGKSQDINDAIKFHKI